MRVLCSVSLKHALAASFVMMCCAACGAAPMSASMPTPIPTQAPAEPSATALASGTTASTSDNQSVRSVVEQFGQHLQDVSLQAPQTLLKQAIQQQYAPFVSPELLSTWLNDPSHALGRAVSSPWPDRIEITSVTRQNDTQYTVTGNEINVTSVELVNGGAAGTQPVRLTVEKQQGRWAITAYERAN